MNSNLLKHEDLSPHPIHYAQIGDLNYAYLKKGEGDLVICLHGFPDMASTWDQTIETLSQQGYCVVAPFLRGYYPTDIPADDDYSMKSIAGDIMGLIKHLGYDKARIIGQDWGASITYAMASFYPEALVQIVTISIPHPSVLRPTLKLLLKARHFLLFNFKKYALWYTRRKNFAYIDYLFGYWSPNWEVPKQTMAVIKASLAEEGRLEAVLGYYWSAYKEARDKELQAAYKKKVTVPATLWGGGTDLIDLREVEGVETAYTAYFKLEFLDEPGHFLHQEAPETFLERTLAFFQNHKHE